jgi:hypothetical protein
LVGGPVPADLHEIGRQEREADGAEVDDDLGEPAGLHEEEAQRNVSWQRAAAPRLFLEIGERTGELHEQDERHEDAEDRDAGVVEDVVGDRRGAECRGDDCQDAHRLSLGQAVVDESMRRVVLAALRHGASFEDPSDGHERRVENRNREHEQRQEDGGDRRSGYRPARGERERGEREAQHLAARVAHENRGAAAPAQVERQEARAGEREREREDEHEPARILRHRVERVVAASDDGQRRREAVHVVQQVERVRDPDEPEEADDDGQHVAFDDLDRQAAAEDDACGGELRCELRERLQRERVVEQAGGEEDRAAAEDPEQL